MLAILGAMDKETARLFREMEIEKEEKCGFSRIAVGRLMGVRCVLACCGIGKVHAAMCAQAVLDRYPVSAVVNIGVAGALDETLAIADCVVATSAVQHDIDTSPIGDPVGLISGPGIVHIPCDEKLQGLLLRAAGETGCRAVRAAIATGDQFIVGTETKQKLKNSFGAAACDMEGGAIAQVCYEYGVPYAAYRTVSDTVSGNGREYELNAKDAADRSQTLLARFLQDYKEDCIHE